MPAGSSSDRGEGPGALTDSNFWDDYWSSVELPSRLDLNDPGTRALSRAVDASLPSPASSSPKVGDLGVPRLVEIGCAPGAWLAHFASLGFEVAGIDESPRGIELTWRNLELQKVDAAIVEGNALELDLADRALEGAFDAVVSLGVVEHFADPAPMMAVHAALARPGATVSVGVPNLTGPIGWLQGRLDRPWLARHNLETLRPSRLRALGEAAGLQCKSVRYAGGFEPHLLEWRDRSYLGFAVTRVGSAYRRIPGSGNWNSRWLSGTLLATYVKPAD